MADRILSPEEVAYRARYGQDTLQGGRQMAQAPRHWAQALAGALQMGLGGHYGANAAFQEKEGKARANSMLAEALMGNMAPKDAASKMLADPWAADAGRAIAARELDPMTGLQRQKAQLEFAQAQKNAPLQEQLMRAKIAAQEREAANGGGLGKTGQVFQGADGKFYAVQYGHSGPKTFPLNDMTPAKGVGIVGDTMYNSATGQTVRNVGDAIASGKKQEVLGKAQGEGINNMPKLKSAYRSMQIADKNLFRSLDKAANLAGPWTTGFGGSLTQWIKGSPSSDLAITLRQVKASLGFASLQQMRDNSPTGGALGQVTERELELLQNAEAALDQAQSEAEFREALAYLKDIKTEYAQLRREAYEADVARFGAAAVPNPETGAMGQGGTQAPSGAVDLRKLYGLE